MSDINTYADQTAIDALTPITGDLVLRESDNNVLLWNGSAWKSFAPDTAGSSFSNEYSLSFDGTSHYLDTGNKFDFMQQTMNFTVSAWIKLQNYTQASNQYILHTTDSGSRIGFMLWFDNRSNTKYLRSRICPSSSVSAFAQKTNAISDNNWHHVAVTCAQGGSIRLYVDGSELNSSLAPSTTTATAMHNFIFGGALNTSGQLVLPFQGNIDEVGIFNRELSNTEVASLIDTSGANPVPANISSFINNGLSAWYRMGDDANDTFVDGGSVASITDSSGNGNTATQATASAQPTFSTSVPA